LSKLETVLNCACIGGDHELRAPARKRESPCSTPQDDPKQTKLLTTDHTIKKGGPSLEELEDLAGCIAEAWKTLGRRLKFDESQLTGFHKENEEYSEKAYKMLLAWKQINASAATYRVLHDALCHNLVRRRDLAEKFCCH